jgi:hypothetical protein
MGKPRGSLRLDVGKLHHLTPLFGFIGDEPAEFGRREDEAAMTFALMYSNWAFRVMHNSRFGRFDTKAHYFECQPGPATLGIY